MDQPIPESLQGETNDSVLAYLGDLSAHSDVSEALEGAIAPLGDAQSYCPDASRYRYRVVATRGVVFAFAVGMGTIGFRLPPEFKDRALASGAESCSQAGRDWAAITVFRADWPVPDLEFWARQAYVYARYGAESGT